MWLHCFSVLSSCRTIRDYYTCFARTNFFQVSHHFVLSRFVSYCFIVPHPLHGLSKRLAIHALTCIILPVHIWTLGILYGQHTHTHTIYICMYKYIQQLIWGNPCAIYPVPPYWYTEHCHSSGTSWSWAWRRYGLSTHWYNDILTIIIMIIYWVVRVVGIYV
jgi:hypothetical protein